MHRRSDAREPVRTRRAGAEFEMVHQLESETTLHREHPAGIRLPVAEDTCAFFARPARHELEVKAGVVRARGRRPIRVATARFERTGNREQSRPSEIGLERQVSCKCAWAERIPEHEAGF